MGSQFVYGVQGASQRGKGHEKPPDASGTLSSHAADVAAVVRHIGKAPVLVGHSFGGLIAQRYALDVSSGRLGYPTVRGLAFLASSNPEGVDFGRFVTRAPVMTAKVCSCELWMRRIAMTKRIQSH
jgi:pimeloyl-ACP methyl ester carboxylesterase